VEFAEPRQVPIMNRLGQTAPARFLYAERPRDGKIVLDFNREVNPPCAFTPFATCPLPPPKNRFPVRIAAGEKNYRGAHCRAQGFGKR
jgi:uncharacterized protein (DUF1684 family)